MNLTLATLQFYIYRVRRVELVIEPGQSLGLMIRGGIEYGLGIYVTGVDKDSVADRAGLNVIFNFFEKVSFIILIFICHISIDR